MTKTPERNALDDNAAKASLQSIVQKNHVRDYITEMLGQLGGMAKHHQLEDISTLLDVTHTAIVFSNPNRLD